MPQRRASVVQHICLLGQCCCHVSEVLNNAHGLCQGVPVVSGLRSWWSRSSPCWQVYLSEAPEKDSEGTVLLEIVLAITPDGNLHNKDLMRAAP